MKKILISIILSLGFAFSFYISAKAQQPTFGFGLRPETVGQGYFTYTLDPGQSVQDAAMIINESDQALVLNVRAVDGHTGLTGGLSLSMSNVAGMATWIAIPSNGPMTIQPHSSERLPFTVSIPDNTPPGEYVAGILATPKDLSGYKQTIQGDSSGTGDSIKVQVVPQVGISVIITVPGPQNCQLDVVSISRSFDYGKMNTSINMRNSGNAHFLGTGIFSIYPTEGGSPVYQKNFNIGYFVAGDSILYPISSNLPQPGKYRAEVKIVSSDDSACAAEYSQEFEITKTEAKTVAAQIEEYQQPNKPKESGVQSSQILASAGLFMAGLAFIIVACLAVYLLVFKKRGGANDTSAL